MKKDFEKYGFSNGDATKHHKNRQMFAIINSKVMIAPKGISESHFVWLKEMGLTEEEAEKIIKYSLRGIYSTNNELYFYKDFNFIGDTSLITEIRKILPELKDGLKLTGQEKVFAGMIIGELGEDWKPKVKLGTVNELLGKI